jgi:hypothetical protein
MRCPNCNAPLEEGSAFCGNCGKQIAPLLARGATVAPTEIIDTKEYGQATSVETIAAPSQASTPAPPQAYGNNQQANPSMQRGPASFPGVPPAQSPMQGGPASFSGIPPAQPPMQGGPTSFPGVPPAQPSRGLSARTVAFIAIILLLLVLSVSAGVLALVRRGGVVNTPTPISGTTGASSPTVVGVSGSVGLATFNDSQNSTTPNSTITINANQLPKPPAGHQYYGWLVDTENENSINNFGPLTLQGQAYTATASTLHTNLIGAGNKVEITLEQGQVTVPTGNIVLSGTFPPQAFVHIRHLLFSFNTTPNKVGLLVGLLAQAKALNLQGQLLANNSQDQQAVRCLAQSIIDISEGQNGVHYQPPSAACQTLNMVQKGDGFGLLGNNSYIRLAAIHASLAATQSDSTPNIKVHAGHVRIAMDDLHGWVTTIDNDANSLLADPTNMRKLQEVVTLSEHVLNGVDLNHDERVDPVPGEAGATTGYIHGQFMAILPLRPGS